MSAELRNAVESSLYETGFHPERAAAADEAANELMAKLKAEPSEVVNANMERVRRMFTDVVLMQPKYFAPRVKFLSTLVTHLGERTEPTVRVADDGCGTGADLYVLRTLLRGKVALTGVDINDDALSVARQRVPDAAFGKSLGNDAFDVIYSDFFSPGPLGFYALPERSEKTFAALRSPGTAFHHADMGLPQEYCTIFGAKFDRIAQPELMGRVGDNHSCYLFRYEKD
jgi:SAM-dependent methyltransferase